MENYTIFNDFESYITENENFINYLNNSLLNDLVLPIIKTLTYLKQLNEEESLSSDNIEIFEFGFKYLFENLEQLKLYLRQYHDDYDRLETKSIYIKMIFQLEEFKVELMKKDEMEVEVQNDLRRIEEAINFFEDSLTANIINEYELDNYIRYYYDLTERYEDVFLMTDAFSEYCSTYGI